MRESTDMSLRTSRSSIVRPVDVATTRRPSSAIPRLTPMKICLDDEARDTLNDNFSIISSAQTMNVYLRIKPQLTKLKRIRKMHQDDTYVVTDSTSLLTKFPSLESGASCPKKSKPSEAANRKFRFTKIFGPLVSQSEIFEELMKPRIAGFLSGQSFTLMTYGTTNSGKTYTLNGNRESPGMIPRSIEFVFSAVNCTLAPWYKPTNICEVIALSETGRSHEIEARENLLASRSLDKAICEEVYASLGNSVENDKECGKNGEAMCSVWLSFVEIYNDNIYDLLVTEETRTKLTPLRLVMDKQGRPFIQGSRVISATTGLDAYRIMMAGRSRLTVGSTTLNPSSSRSHAIFTMTLLKYTKERVPEDVEMTTMTFCDLAGTGRSRKSSSAGNELKEAKNINTSLLVLGRCLQGISDSQTTRQSVEVVGPFRESKLTRLFQRGISGKENLCFLVNIDSSPDLYVETQAVLTFASMARKIVVDAGKDGKLMSNLETMSGTKDSLPHERVRPTTVALIETSEKRESSSKSEIEKLKELNDTLTKENTILREAALNREYETRQEMVSLHASIMKDMNAKWQKRIINVEEKQEDYLKWSFEQMQIFYNDRIDSLTKGKRRRTSGGDQLDDGREPYEELKAENSHITSEVVALRQTVKHLKEELETLGTDKNKCVFELSLAKDVIKQIRQLLDNETGGKIIFSEENIADIVDDLRSLITEKNKTIASLKKCLEIAKKESLEMKQNSITKAEIIDPELPEITRDAMLKSLTQRELEDELYDRTGVNSVDKQSIGTQVLEERLMIEEKEIGTKFSSSTFKKESNDFFLPSSTRYSIIEGENSMVDEETTRAINSTGSFQRSSFQKDESLKNLHSSFLETIENAFRSSIESCSKDDSGIAISNAISSSTENSLSHSTDDKSSQTNFDNLGKTKKISESIQERVEQLKIDYTKLKSEHLHETLRVTELSQELESIQLSLSELKESTRQNELKIIEYQEKLVSREKDLSNLGQLKFEMEKQLELRSSAYEEKILKLREQLEIHESNENRAFECLEECQEKTSILESQLIVAHGQIDKISLKCYSEHVPRINDLERELTEKSQRMNDLNAKMSKFEKDLERVYDLNERVTSFAKIFTEYQGETEKLRRQLLERSETQTSLECKIKRLTSKVHERENEISSLQMDLGNVVKMNMENSERAQDLSKEIAVADNRLTNVRDEMTRSEEERRRLERTSGQEIGNLVARLADFEKNATILARMKDNEDSRTDELDTLKLLLHEKEREMSLFKKNRDKTVRRYLSFFRKLLFCSFLWKIYLRASSTLVTLFFMQISWNLKKYCQHF